MTGTDRGRGPCPLRAPAPTDGGPGHACHSRGSTGSDSSASTANTASWTRHSGSPSASRSSASSPSAYSRSASDRLWFRNRLRRRSRFSGRVYSGP